MKISRHHIILVIALAAVAVLPERAVAQFRWAATASVTYNDLKFKQDLGPVSQAVGYGAGVTAEMMFPGIGFGIDFGLLYSQKGATVDLGSKTIWAEDYGNERVYMHYLHIPLHLRFKWTRMNGLEEKIAPFVYGGPDFTIRIANGRCDAFDYAGGDLGLSVGGGVELWRNYQVSFGYTWGMSYVLRTKLLDNFSDRNREWFVRLSYYFK